MLTYIITQDTCNDISRMVKSFYGIDVELEVNTANTDPDDLFEAIKINSTSLPEDQASRVRNFIFGYLYSLGKSN